MNEDIKLRNRKFYLKQFLEVEDLGAYIEKYMGIDFRIAYEDGVITPYVEQLIQESGSFQHSTDTREDIVKVREIIFSRCVEHYLIDYFGGLTLCGSDKDSIITRTSTRFPDLRRGKGAFYEVVNCTEGQYEERGSIYISKKKLDYLCDLTRQYKITILAVDVNYRKYWEVDLTPDIEDLPLGSEEINPEMYCISLKSVLSYKFEKRMNFKD